MPEYDYVCENGHGFSVDKSMSEAAKTETCPVCQGAAHRKFNVPMLNTWFVDYTQMAPNQGELEFIDGGGYE